MKMMKIEYDSKRLLIALPPLFFLLTAGANIAVYRGGHATEYLGTGYYFDEYLREYDADQKYFHFALNFVSDLGRLKTYHGSLNLPSVLIFCVCLSGTGILFLLALHRINRCRTGRPLDRMQKVVLDLCKLSAISFILIGWIPEDIHEVTRILHLVCVNCAFGSTMAISIIIVLMKPRWITGFYLFLFAVLSAYLALIVYWYFTRRLPPYLGLTIGQKVIVLLMVIHMFLFEVLFERFDRPTRDR
jgi:hypothetical protein